MKKFTLFFVLLLACIYSGKVTASGGPDAYGYEWITSLDGGGPAFGWIDITGYSGVQTVSGLSDDNAAPSMINLGFSFHYYWSDHTQLKVGSNGWLGFNNTSNIASCFPTIPTAGGSADNYLAPLMSDLNFTGVGNPGSVKYWTNNVDSFIISYITVPAWVVGGAGWSGANSFQVILCKSDSSITFQYGSLSGITFNAACVDMTVGIENSTGATGLQVHSDATPPSNYVIRFDPPNVPLISIQDVIPQWNANDDSEAEIIVKDVAYSPSSNIRNAGNANVTTDITLQATIRDLASTTVHSASGTLPSLAAGDDSLFEFTSWTPAAAGLHSFETTITNSQDINPANNTLTTELLVMDVCNSSATLSYVNSGLNPNGSINWNGGANDDGVGIYLSPPVYPYTVSSLQFFISSNVGGYFIAKIYDDDGAGGSPGTELFTATIPGGSVVTAAWNTVAVNPGVVLNDGGFYVTWLQGNTTIFLGTQTNGAASHLTYEIIDGSWAKLRYNDRDAFIRATIDNYSTAPDAGFSSALNSLLDYTFTNTTTGMDISWLWDFGDGNTSTDENPGHTYASGGNYNVCLTATSLCNQTNTFCELLSVCESPSITTDPPSPTICSFGGTNFSVVAAGSGLNYQWEVNDGGGFQSISEGAPYSNVQTATLTIGPAVLSMNNYLYRCVVTGDCGSATSNSGTLTVNAQPNVTLSTFADMCENDAGLTLTGGSPAGGTYSGPGVSSGVFDPLAAGFGTHNITYTYTNVNNCTNFAMQSITVNIPPTVTLGSFSALCVNSGSLTLSGGSPSGGTYSGPGVSSGIFNPSTAGAGTHTITYSYTDGNSCTSSATSTITVNALPSVTLGSFSGMCIDAGSLTLSGGAPSGGTYSGPGVSSGIFNPLTAGAGTHTITYSYTDGNSCTSAATSTITVNALPSVTLGSFSGMCVDAGTLTLSGGAPSGGTYSGTGVSSGVFSPLVAGAGTHTITYSYTDGNSCSSSATSTITVNTLPSVTLGSFSAMCADAGSLTLSGGAPSGGTYSGPGVSAGVFNPLTAGAGTHTITYSYTDGNSCSSSATSTITVNASPSVTLGSYSGVCVDAGSLTLSGGAPSGGTYSGPGVSAGVLNTLTAGAGTHTITYSYTDGNSCTASATTTITVNALPTVTLGSFSDLCVDASPLTLSGGSPAGGTYSGTGVSAGVFDPASAGTGATTISYVFVDAIGCSGSATEDITVNALPTVTLSSFANVCDNGGTVTLSGGAPSGGVYSGTGVSGGDFDPATAGVGTHSITYTYTDVCTGTAQEDITVDLCTGIEQAASNTEFSVYPNPSSGLITIKTSYSNAMLEISDILGNLVSGTKLTGTVTTLNLAHLSNGLYTLRILPVDGSAAPTRKIVVQVN